MLINPIKYITLFAIKTIVKRFNLSPVFSTVFTSLTLRSISLISQFGVFPVIKALWYIRKYLILAALPLDMIRNKLSFIPDYILDPILDVIRPYVNDCIVMPKTFRAIYSLFLFLMSFKLLIPAGALLSRIVLILLGLSYISSPFASFLEMIKMYSFITYREIFSIFNDALEHIKDYWREIRGIKSYSSPVEPLYSLPPAVEAQEVKSIRKEYSSNTSSVSFPLRSEEQSGDGVVDSLRKDYKTPAAVVNPEPVVLGPTFTLSIGDIFFIFILGIFFMGFFETFYHDTIHYIPNKIGEGIQTITRTFSIYCQALYLTFNDPFLSNQTSVPRVPETDPFSEASIDPWNIPLPSPTPSESFSPTGSLSPVGSQTGSLSPLGSLTPRQEVTPRPAPIVLPELPDLPEWPRS